MRDLHVGDIVIYDDQRMRVRAFVSGTRMRLVAMHGKPARVEVSIKDKRVKKVSAVRSVYGNEEA